jgi:hypothetical protein
MSTRNRILSAIVFAAMWTAIMLWWSYPDKGVAHTAILAVIGLGLGMVLYWLTGRQRPSA